MKKRTLILILALLMICSLLPVSAAADAPKSGTCGENLTWTLDDTGVLTISGTGDMYNYGAPAGGAVIDAPWKAYADDVNSIVIENGVTSIGSSTFNCSNAKSVSIPDSVTSIGESAFYNCGLTEINIPGSVTSIGDRAFCYCNFAEVRIPSGVKELPQEIFCGCHSLTSITLPNAITVISTGAFSYCDALKSIVIPAGVKTIERGAFADCTALESIYLPSGLKTIEPFAFHVANPTPVIKNVYFAGTEAQWKAVSIGERNDRITAATIHCGVSAYPFTDVDISGRHLPFADAILWAANEGITTGVDKTHFAPNSNCTRAQVVTFLWRAAGYPAPKSTDNPFDDVTEKLPNGNDNPFYTAILWAAGEGITLGIDETHFAPDRSVTRAQFVAFLWRYENKPEPKPGMTITDIGSAANVEFKVAILWAAGEGITTGYSDGSFQPNATCSRAHVVTFIYRDMA